MSDKRYVSRLTPYGKSIATGAYNSGETVQITHMAVGFGVADNGNGQYDLDSEQTELLNEWYRFEANRVYVDENNPAWIVTEGIIPENIGGHWINEVSIIDSTGQTIAIASWPPTYKPLLNDGNTASAVVRLTIKVDSTDNFEIIIDHTKALVTRDEFLKSINEIQVNANIGAITEAMEAHDTSDTAHEDIRAALAAINSAGVGGSKTNNIPALISADENNLITVGVDGKLLVSASAIGGGNVGGGNNSGNNGGGNTNGGGDNDGNAQGLVFGVRWHKNVSPTTLSRIHDSAGYFFAPERNGSEGASSFDDKPIYKDIKKCNMINGIVTAYEGEFGFENAPAAGDVMVEIPRYYYKVIDTTSTRDFLISDIKHDDTWLVSPRHAPTTENPNGWEKIYTSAYTLNSAYRSISGNQSLTQITRSTARTGCRNRGGGANGKYHQLDYLTYCTLSMLYLVETANWDSQAAVGQGNVSTSAQLATGDANSVTYHSGSAAAITATNRAVKWRHMENLWGNIRYWVDGININSHRAHICFNPSQYADDTATNYTQLGYTNATTDGYIKAIGYDEEFPLAQLPTNSTGAESTYLADYYWQGSGWRVLNVGGYWSDGSQAGLFCAHATNGSASTGTTVGCRLLVLP